MPFTSYPMCQHTISTKIDYFILSFCWFSTTCGRNVHTNLQRFRIINSCRFRPSVRILKPRKRQIVCLPYDYKISSLYVDPIMYMILYLTLKFVLGYWLKLCSLIFSFFWLFRCACSFFIWGQYILWSLQVDFHFDIDVLRLWH